MSTSVRDCSRCVGIKKDTKRCTRRTCKIAHKCFQHLRIEDGLAVKKSKILGAGLGLFATTEFPFHPHLKNQVTIAKYNIVSEFMNQAPLKKGQATDYTWCADKKERRCFSATSTQSTVGRYCNACDRPKHRKECNAKINQSGNIKPIKTIQAGDEILIDYGPSYWRHHRTKKTTRRK